MIEDLLKAYMAGGKQLQGMFGLSPKLSQIPESVPNLPPDFIDRLARLKGK